jgi:hypothetical protein
MYLSLPVPQGKQKVVLQELIDSFVQTEVMEKDDAWCVGREVAFTDPVADDTPTGTARGAKSRERQPRVSPLPVSRPFC